MPASACGLVAAMKEALRGTHAFLTGALEGTEPLALCGRYPAAGGLLWAAALFAAAGVERNAGWVIAGAMGLHGLGALQAETGVSGYPPKQCVRAPAKNGRSRASGSRRRRRLQSECGVVNYVLMEQPAPFSAAKRPQRASLALGPLWERTAVIPMRHPPVEPQDGRWDLSAAENRPLVDGCWGIWVPPTTVDRPASLRAWRVGWRRRTCAKAPHPLGRAKPALKLAGLC